MVLQLLYIKRKKKKIIIDFKILNFKFWTKKKHIKNNKENLLTQKWKINIVFFVVDGWCFKKKKKKNFFFFFF